MSERKMHPLGKKLGGVRSACLVGESWILLLQKVLMRWNFLLLFPNDLLCEESWSCHIPELVPEEGEFTFLLFCAEKYGSPGEGGEWLKPFKGEGGLELLNASWSLLLMLRSNWNIKGNKCDLVHAVNFSYLLQFTLCILSAVSQTVCVDKSPCSKYRKGKEHFIS